MYSKIEPPFECGCDFCADTAQTCHELATVAGGTSASSCCSLDGLGPGGWPVPNTCISNHRGTSYHCGFPFTYEGKVYNSCTAADTEDHFWCESLREDGGFFSSEKDPCQMSTCSMPATKLRDSFDEQCYYLKNWMDNQLVEGAMPIEFVRSTECNGDCDGQAST